MSPIERAWEEIYIAEGSDWFWWYGDDHSSAQDALFDYLFRKHLQNVYKLLGDEPPPELARPISRRTQRAIYTQPRTFLDVKIDGLQTYFEWATAGRYTCQNERGTMTMVLRGPLKELFFGFTVQKLLVRVDCETPARAALAGYEVLRLSFVEPAGWEVLVKQPGRPGQRVELLRQGQVVEAPDIEVGIDQIAELSVPFERLGVKAEQPMQFFVDLLEGGQSRDRAPREGTISLVCPSANFELIMWNV